MTKSEIVGLAERLAERCENAMEKDTHFMMLEIYNHLVVTGIIKWDHKKAGLFHGFIRVQAYLDAAMALVIEPEKGVSVWRTPRDGVLCCATVHRGPVTEARTMPLALCAAALRARATLKEDENG